VIKLVKPVEVHGWGNDAKPETPTVTGEWILVDWLTKEDNCIKHKGEDNGGHAKKHCCLIMASKCTQLTLCERTHKTVLTKVSAMEDQWRNAHDWVNNTGVGVLRDDGKDVFDNLVTGRCSFCCDLEPIMIDEPEQIQLQLVKTQMIQMTKMMLSMMKMRVRILVPFPKPSLNRQRKRRLMLKVRRR